MDKIKKVFKIRGKAAGDQKESAKRKNETPSVPKNESRPQRQSTSVFQSTLAKEASNTPNNNNTNGQVESSFPDHKPARENELKAKPGLVHNNQQSTGQKNNNQEYGSHCPDLQRGAGNYHIIDRTTCQKEDITPTELTNTKLRGRTDSVGSMGGWSMGGGSMGGHSFGGGGCFLGTNTIRMADGSTVLVQDISKGDRVACNERGDVKGVISCVLVTKVPAGSAPMVTLPKSGLCITPGHPILVNNSWIKPKDIQPVTLTNCDCYYNFLLEDGGASVIVNGIVCVALGHGIKGKVTEHGLWSDSQKVTSLMREFDSIGFSEGRVEISNNLIQTKSQEADP